MDSYRLINYCGHVHTIDQQLPASGHAKAASKSNLPGLWASILSALLFGTLFWFSVGSGIKPATPEGSGAEKLELAQVDEQDIGRALDTMGGSRSFQAQFKQEQNTCPQPLAWVSLMRAKPGSPMTIRLRSGGYISPTFTLADAPIRVAIPYPAPYESGHGALSIVAAGGDAIVSLLPVWRVAGGAGMTSREVTWHPTVRCPR